MTENNEWDIIITPKKKFLNFSIRSLMEYKDLVFMLIKRNFVVFYKQTILGPLWYIIQPLVNTIIFTIIFGKVAKIPTDGIPPFIFYMCGNIIWSYYAACLSSNANIFGQNQSLFAKIYFPRMVVPFSNVVSSCFQFFIQFTLFICFLIYFKLRGSELGINWYMMLMPLLIFQLALLGIGVGTFFSSLTAKYRDLSFTMGFIVQLWMYATPIVYPLSLIPNEYKIYAYLNPMTGIVEVFRYMSFGKATLSFGLISSSISITFIILIIGILSFNKVEQKAMDFA